MYLSISQAASLMGVSISTLRRWEADGSFTPALRTKGKHRRYSEQQVQEYLGHNMTTERHCIAYSRVSSSDQKKDLIRQEERLKEYCHENFGSCLSISDLGSGLKYDKRGLQKLIKLICKGQVSHLVLTHRDRLFRFGAQIIFSLCQILKAMNKYIQYCMSKLFNSMKQED